MKDAIAIDLAGPLGAMTLAIRAELPAAGITALFGPSGCGKTTVLRCLAGLQTVSGHITVAGETWQDTEAGLFVPPHRRHVGYVFQEASLFPHLSVRDNLLYGARRVVRAGSSQPSARLDDIVQLLGIAPLLDRGPERLSGGERQRVAVGRALLSEPRILLMDEPLSALDDLTRDEILPYFEMLHEALAVPILYVSHDLDEIERLADTMLLMAAGRAVACGPLAKLQTDPTLPLLDAQHATVVIEGRVAAKDSAFALTELDVEGGRMIVPGLHGEIGDRRRLRIAASDVSLARSAPRDSTILNCLAVRIISVDGPPGAAQMSVILGLGPEGAGARIAARVTRKSLETLGFKAGSSAFAQIKSVALVASRGRR